MEKQPATNNPDFSQALNWTIDRVTKSGLNTVMTAENLKAIQNIAASVVGIRVSNEPKMVTKLIYDRTLDLYKGRVEIELEVFKDYFPSEITKEIMLQKFLKKKVLLY
jgi:hypothetical protein